jgi:hypothetical protein
MLPVLLIPLSVLCWISNVARAENSVGFSVQRNYDDEALLSDNLARVRRGVALREKNLALREWFLTEFVHRYTENEIGRRKREIDMMRFELQKWKLLQRELERYEKELRTDPGPETERAALERYKNLLAQLWPTAWETAPPPREVKPSAPGGKP